MQKFLQVNNDSKLGSIASGIIRNWIKDGFSDFSLKHPQNLSECIGQSRNPRKMSNS